MAWVLDSSTTITPAAGDALGRSIAESAEREALSGPRWPGRFEGFDSIWVVLPSELDHLPQGDAKRLRELRPLLEVNRSSLESELGVRAIFDAPPRDTVPKWLIGPTRCTPALARLGLDEPTQPILQRLPEQRRLITNASTVTGIYESLSLLRTAVWTSEDVLEGGPCHSEEEAFVRTASEVAHTWPSFRRRRISWLALCYRYSRELSRGALDAARRMLATLGDAHTAIRHEAAMTPASFRARAVGDQIILHEVSDGTAAWRAGAREGFRLLNVDLQNAAELVGASPHHRPFAIPYRLLCGTPGVERELSAAGPEGQIANWSETYEAPPADVLVSWRRLPSGAGYLRIRQWLPSESFAQQLERAFDDFKAAPGLVVDLRGNPGGNLQVASLFRDRFLRERTRLGNIQFAAPDGELLPPSELWAEPAPPERRWRGSVRFLTDAGTYSASEDALLGLQGLDHVHVIGAPSGGGSGRARNVHLLPGWRLMVSSCLTSDRMNHCIEGAGIPVDREVPMGDATHSVWERALLSIADSVW